MDVPEHERLRNITIRQGTH